MRKMAQFDPCGRNSGSFLFNRINFVRTKLAENGTEVMSVLLFNVLGSSHICVNVLTFLMDTSVTRSFIIDMIYFCDLDVLSSDYGFVNVCQ